MQSDEGLRKIGKGHKYLWCAAGNYRLQRYKNKVWTRPFDGKKLTDIDASIITDHMMMEATYLGLGKRMGMLFQAGHPEGWNLRFPTTLNRSTSLSSATPTPLVKRLCPQIAMQKWETLFLPWYLSRSFNLKLYLYIILFFSGTSNH